MNGVDVWLATPRKGSDGWLSFRTGRTLGEKSSHLQPGIRQGIIALSVLR
jgi:hypothetical protein